MAPHVLVADDDAWILRMVATVLEKRGYSVETAVDGEDALERALARTPDLLITDVMMPKMDGWSLVRQLRAHPDLAMLPVIFLSALSSEDDRIRGFRLGADDFVTKPFRFEELDLRVAKTLRRAHQQQQDTRDQLTGSGLRGDLSQVGLSSLLVLIEMERKTGLLQLRAPNGPSGQILVREGKVVHAHLDDQEEPVDAECVYYLLTWGAGEFEFIACVVEGVDRVNVSTTHLLMEGARLMDEANEPSLKNAAVAIPTKVDSTSTSDQPGPFDEPIESPDLDEPIESPDLDEPIESPDFDEPIETAPSDEATKSAPSDDAIESPDLDDAIEPALSNADIAPSRPSHGSLAEAAAAAAAASHEAQMRRSAAHFDAPTSRGEVDEGFGTTGTRRSSPVLDASASRAATDEPAASSAAPTPPSSRVPTRPSSPATDTASNRPSSPATDAGSNRPSSPATDAAYNRPSSPATDTASNRPSSPATDTGSNRPSSPATDAASKRPSSPATETASKRPSSPATDTAIERPSSPAADGALSRPSNPTADTAPGRPTSPAADAALSRTSSSGAAPDRPSSPAAETAPNRPSSPASSASSSQPFGTVDDPSDDGWE